MGQEISYELRVTGCELESILGSSPFSGGGWEGVDGICAELDYFDFIPHCLFVILAR